MLNAASSVEPALKTTVVRMVQMCGMKGIGWVLEHKGMGPCAAQGQCLAWVSVVYQ